MAVTPSGSVRRYCCRSPASTQATNIHRLPPTTNDFASFSCQAPSPFMKVTDGERVRTSSERVKPKTPPARRLGTLLSSRKKSLVLEARRRNMPPIRPSSASNKLRAARRPIRRANASQRTRNERSRLCAPAATGALPPTVSFPALQHDRDATACQRRQGGSESRRTSGRSVACHSRR